MQTQPKTIEALTARLLFDAVLVQVTMMSFSSKYEMNETDEMVAFSVAGVAASSARQAMDMTDNLTLVEKEFDTVVQIHREATGGKLSPRVESGIKAVKELLQEQNGSNATLQ